MTDPINLTSASPSATRLTDFTDSLSQLNDVLESMGDGLVIADSDGCFLMWNQAAVQMVGRGPEEVEPEDWASHYGVFLTDRITPMSEHELPLVLAIRGEATDDVELFIRNPDLPDGAFVSVSGRPLRNHDGELAGGCIVLRDTTRRHRDADRLRRLGRRVLDDIEMERLSVGRDLHDGPLQDVYALDFILESLASGLSDDASLAALESARGVIQEAARGLREVCRDLRPALLGEFGLAMAIEAHADTHRADHAETRLELDLMHEPLGLEPGAELHLYRIYQNVMGNVWRHAHATCAQVRLTNVGENVVLEVIDDGRGFRMPEDTKQLLDEASFGIVHAMERTDLLGGEMSVHSIPGEGTHVRVTVPIRYQRDGEA